MEDGFLSTRGERAISQAQLGQPDKRSEVRVGAFAWALMALLAFIFCGQIARSFGIIEYIVPLIVALQLTTLVLAVVLVRDLNAQTRNQREANARETREVAEAEQKRQLDAFLQQKKGFAPKSLQTGWRDSPERTEIRL